LVARFQVQGGFLGVLTAAPSPRLGCGLRRCGLADLMLDSLHYNAHTTATDALWAGVPIVTLPGGSARLVSGLVNVSKGDQPNLARHPPIPTTATPTHGGAVGGAAAAGAGEMMQSRVAAGLIHAVGLPELIVDSLKEYEDLVVALAAEPGRAYK
jgi:predicted O-linked N-acetylglucosamine transferase (SPINDLY family)